MTKRFHTPPSGEHDFIPENAPLLFLAGPIQGSPNWQDPTARELLQALPGVHVASPRRNAASNAEFDYEEQVSWELSHLKRSNKLGAIAFWFAAQDHTLDYEAGRPYAQTSRVEIGRALGWNDLRPFPLIVGFEDDYTKNGGGNEKYIRSMAKAADVPVYNSLDDVIEQTITQTQKLKVY